MTDEDAILAPDVLELVWANWHLRQYGDDMSQRYRTLHRQNHRAREFESWLFDQGAEVRQINKQRHLRFYNERQATMFLLRWT